MLIPRFETIEAIKIVAKELKSFFQGLDVSDSTRGKYRAVTSRVFNWGISEELIPEFIEAPSGGYGSSNPCSRVKGSEFSQESDYEALALEVEETFALLGELEQPEYELALLVATCGFRISEALGLCWRDILWGRAMISIRQTCVHNVIQDGAKTLLSRSRVEVPQLALDVLAEWRKQTIYARDNDYVFPSVKLSGKCPRSASMLVEDYIRPAAIRAGILIERDGKTYSKDGDLVKRFGFHNLGRHSLATFLMDEQENPAVVQAIMRHAKMDMTLYYSHSSKKAKRAAVENYAQRIAPESRRVPMRVQQSQAVN